MRGFFVMGLALALTSCGEDPLPPGRVVLTQGGETNTWSAEPPVEVVEVVEVNDDGERLAYATLEPPSNGDEVSFELTGEDTSRFEVRGLDEEGALQALGLSWPYDAAGLQGFEVSLFIGRVGSFGRVPEGLARGQREGAPVALLAGRYLVAMGAEGSGELPIDAYDFGTWATAAVAPMRCPSEPCVVRSLSVAGETIVLAIADDWAMTVDLDAVSASQAYELEPPDGLDAWADVAGGASINAPDGTAYVIGGTRAEGPTASVIRVAPDGETRSLELTAPRAGASAAWVDGLGLVVSGGSETAAGAELLADGASAFVAMPFAPDPVSGAALLPLGEGAALRVGGRDATTFAATAELDLSCSVECVPVPRDDTVALDRVSTFLLEDGAVFAVGQDEDGATRAMRLQEGTTSEITLREPRRGATAIRTALGHVAVVGGSLEDGSAATSIELYTPACLDAGCPEP